tara:strand:- start:7584 stop:8165 length:582 start_codon:yes stop_codon:yes gene_type:complete
MDKLKKKRKRKRSNKIDLKQKIKNPMEGASKSIMSSTLRTGPIKKQTVDKTKTKVEKDIDLVQGMAASRVKLDDSLEEVDAKQNDAAEFLNDVRRLNPEKKSGAKRTESPLAKYKCSYNYKRSSLKKSEGEDKVENRKVIKDRGRGLGGITQDTITNKFYSQTNPKVEMDSTHTRNPFDRSLITVNWHQKKEK